MARLLTACSESIVAMRVVAHTDARARACIEARSAQREEALADNLG